MRILFWLLGPVAKAVFLALREKIKQAEKLFKEEQEHLLELKEEQLRLVEEQHEAAIAASLEAQVNKLLR